MMEKSAPLFRECDPVTKWDIELNLTGIRQVWPKLFVGRKMQTDTWVAEEVDYAGCLLSSIIFLFYW